MKSRQFLTMNQHTIELCQAALPYVAPTAQSPMNMLIKATEFADTMEEMRHPPDLSACNVNQQPVDPETLLVNIRPVCNESEAQFVDTILNFLNAGKIYSMYQTYMNAMKQTEEMNQAVNNAMNTNPHEQTSNPSPNWNPFVNSMNAPPDQSANSNEPMSDLKQEETKEPELKAAGTVNDSENQTNNPTDANGSMNPMDFLLNQLSPEQRSTFQALNMMMNMNRAQSTNSNAESHEEQSSHPEANET